MAVASLVGGATTLCGPIAGAFVSGTGSVAMELMDGTTNPQQLGMAFAIGFGASMFGAGAEKLTKIIGGPIALKNLSHKSPGEIKRVITSTIRVAGKDRNMIKDISWALSQPAYAHLKYALVGKMILKTSNSIATGISGYAIKGAIYGLY